MKHPTLPPLKHCPCCKSTDILRGFSTEDATRAFVRCKECGIGVSRVVTEHRTPKRALLGCTVAWNTRPPELDPRFVQIREAAQTALYDLTSAAPDVQRCANMLRTALGLPTVPSAEVSSLPRVGSARELSLANWQPPVPAPASTPATRAVTGQPT